MPRFCCIFLFVTIFCIEAYGQVSYDDFSKIIGALVKDKEFNQLLFSYDYHGDRPLFIGYNKIIKDKLDTSTFHVISDWQYAIDFNFDHQNVYLREYGFLFNEHIGYYLQFDSMEFSKQKAIIKFRTNTISGKIKNLKYFTGEIELTKVEENWFISRRKIKNKEQKSKW